MLIGRVNIYRETNEQRQRRERNENVTHVNLEDPHHTGAGEVAENYGDVTYVYIKVRVYKNNSILF
jgi:hypothetical protein